MCYCGVRKFKKRFLLLLSIINCLLFFSFFLLLLKKYKINVRNNKIESAKSLNNYLFQVIVILLINNKSLLINQERIDVGGIYSSFKFSSLFMLVNTKSDLMNLENLIRLLHIHTSTHFVAPHSLSLSFSLLFSNLINMVYQYWC